ncbi:MAG: sensor histidine kinase [Gemmatimonadota bacterium]
MTRWLRRWALLFAAATALALFFASRTYLTYYAYPDNEITWARSLAPALSSWYVWAFLAPAILWLAMRLPFDRGRWRRNVGLHLLAGIAFALGHYFLEYVLGQWIEFFPARSVSAASIINQFHYNVITYWLIVGGAKLIEYSRRSREREVRASQLEAHLADARLQALKMQLHPHFLFNTLHAITTLMHRDVDAAERMLARLSELLRITLDSAGAQEVTLKEELEFLEQYLEIERIRFGDRLRIEMNVDPDSLDARVPNLVLQPIVENAIRHGIAPKAGPGWIGVSSRRRDGQLELVVEDDGRGLPADDRDAGVGLSNTRARLLELYGDSQRLDMLASPAGGALVRLTIPFRDD